MNVTSRELARLYSDATARSVHRGQDCVSEETLARAAAGELSRSEREELADHLSACSDCAREYRAIAELGAWAREAAREAAHDAIDEAAPGIGAPTTGAAGSRDRIRVAPAWPERLQEWWREQSREWIGGGAPLGAAMAAALIVALSLGGWVVVLRRSNQALAISADRQVAALNQELESTRHRLADSTRLNERHAGETAALRHDLDALSQPQPNEPVLDLDPRDSTRGPASSGSSRTLNIPASAAVFTLILNTAEHPAFPDYSLRVVDPSGRTVWTGEGLRKSRFDTFTVAFPSRLLPPGRYRFILAGLRGSQRSVLEEYDVTLHYQ